MRASLALALRAACLASGLWLAQAGAAEPTSPLMGLTRAQVLSRYGEPRSQIEAGDRMVFLYPRERVTFRGDVVVDVEPIIPEPVRRPPPPPETAAPAEPATPAAGSTPATGSSPTAADPAAAPAAPGGRASSGGSPASSSATPTTAPTAPVTPPPEPKVEIKLVRSPGAKDAAPPPPAPRPVAPAPTPEPTPAQPAVVEPAAPSVPLSATPVSDANEARLARERAAAAEKEQKAKAAKEARRRLEEAARAPEAASGGGMNLSWIYIAGGIAAGIALIYWRARRRPIDVAAQPAAAGAGAGLGGGAAPGADSHFSAELLEELPYGRFEQLVVAYYSKTGVVAVPTAAGPDAPVQVKISWKGEPRPFAYVRCITTSAGVVDVKPLKDLQAALAADDIRRGYVVTAGRFSPAARALAADQQLTLMSGEVLLEKLNALPESARRELMRDIGAA